MIFNSNKKPFDTPAVKPLHLMNLQPIFDC